MLSGLKWIAVLVCISVSGYAVYDYGSTKKHNAELTIANATLEESRKSVDIMLQKIDNLSAKVDRSLSRVQSTVAKLDGVSRAVRSVGTEAKKNDETYSTFVNIPIHPTSLRMFEQVRYGSYVQDENTIVRASDTSYRHPASPRVETR